MSKIPANRKAPPPDRPLNVGGPGIHFPSQIKTKTPDWNFWRGMRKVLYWQACALSVGADPDTMGRRPGDSAWSYDAHHLDQLPKSSQETLKKRLKLLAANRYERTIFTLPMAQYSGLNTGEVFLSEFAAWGVSLGWDNMPQELVAMAQEQAVIAPKVAPVAEPPPQSATHERFERLLFSELWSEEELLSIMCGDARRLFGSGHSASDIEREYAHGAILDGIGVESLIVNDWRQVESKEWMVPPATVRYFKPDQAIAWVNRDRFPKFPFPASEVMAPVSKLQPVPASEPVTPAALPICAPSDALTDTSRPPPGKDPSTSVGKLAVKAAWIIECKQNRRATDKEVMSLLQEWADKGSEPAVLKKSQMNNRCVIWTTDKCKEKTYTLEACQKALRTWNKSRQ